jgi:hypothetical protein
MHRSMMMDDSSYQILDEIIDHYKDKTGVTNITWNGL